jgi:hypothetical protein
MSCIRKAYVKELRKDRTEIEELKAQCKDLQFRLDAAIALGIQIGRQRDELLSLCQRLFATFFYESEHNRIAYEDLFDETEATLVKMLVEG